MEWPQWETGDTWGTTMNALSRKEFLISLTAGAFSATANSQPDSGRPKVLLVVAHPDDEYAFAGTVYRIAQELHGSVDQVVITNGEGGYRYSQLAERFYNASLTREDVGRSRLPEIRKQETLAASRILGIEKHYFLDQKDARFTLDASEAFRLWNIRALQSFLTALIEKQRYSFVFTLLPYADTHGHHKAATLITLAAVSNVEPSIRPVVLGADPAQSTESPRFFRGLSGYSETASLAGSPVFRFDRKTSFGPDHALSYQIVVNWVIAEHKSQGLFQTDFNKHDEERFWILGANPAALEKTERLFNVLQPPSAKGGR